MNVNDTKYYTNKEIWLKLKDVGTTKQLQVKIKRQKIIFLIKQVYILKLSVFFVAIMPTWRLFWYVSSVTLEKVLIEVASLPRIYMHTAKNIYLNVWFQIVEL